MRGKKQFPQKKKKKVNQFALFSMSDFLSTLAPGLDLEPKQDIGHFSSPGPGPAKNQEAGSAVRSPWDTLITVRV